MEQRDSQHEMTMGRYIREHERQKARAESSEENFKKTFADLMRQQHIKESLAADAQAATKDNSRRESSRNLDSLREQCRRTGYESDETITGNEPLPWDADY